MIRKLLLLVLLFTLTGCSAVGFLAPPTRTPAPTPTACIPLNSRGGDPNCTPIPIRSAPPSPPTATMSPPSPTATLARSAQVSPIQPTPQPVETWSSTSPDGNWIVQGHAEFPATRTANATYHIKLQVARKDGGQTWTVVDQTLPYQSDYVTPQVFYWSVDGARLYFANLPHPEGCVLLFNARDLQRVDLATGRVQVIEPQVSFTQLIGKDGRLIRSVEGYVLALSPDQTTVAYIAEGRPLRVTLRDVTKGAEQQVELKGAWSSDDSQAGAIRWSLDNKAILFSVFDHPCDPTHQQSWIVRAEIPSLTSRTIKYYDNWLMRVIGWSGPQTITTADGLGHGNIWLNAENGNIESPTR